jgi:hypothetical protein
MTQVDQGLTKINGFDWATSANKKPGTSQPTPVRRNLIPRFDYKEQGREKETYGFQIVENPGTWC